MRLAVFGATGLTGGQVMAQALAQGHEVVALVRDPARVALAHPCLRVLGGSPTRQADVERCVQRADAVIHCLGIGGKGDGRPNSLVSDSVEAVLAAMQRQGVPRIVCMSNVGAGGSGTWFANRIVLPIFLRWLQPIDKPVRTSAEGRGIGLSITAASAARFLLARATGNEWLRATPSISN
jgi:nucleoside-diphosphate-sugar epimerase